MLWLKTLKMFKIISKKRFENVLVIHKIKKSGLFDTKYYLRHNLDVKKSKMNPVEHYLNYGWRECRNPSEKFNTLAYLNDNPDVKSANICPLVHYVNWGIKEGRVAITVSGEILFNKSGLKEKIKYAFEYPVRVHDEYHRLKDEIRNLKNSK